jgi:putative radical SAM enzyme (TIGR03279 family)
MTPRNHPPAAPTARISAVGQGSPAHRAGVASGWELLAVNGREIPDILAYRRELERGEVELLVRSPEGEPREFRASWEDPGLEFDEVIFDGIRLCANKCEFCYVHQMPKGMRRSLYMMDDDFRTSFLYGSFVTLTNLSEADVHRILNEELSPLYVSVHAADEELRRDMMKWWRLKVKDDKSTSIRGMIERLRPIDLYTQLVVLPGRNDGEHLTRTLEYLAAQPNVQAAAVVPVGLTEHRRNLPDLRGFTQEEARDVIVRVRALQKRLLAERGTRFVFLSDEFYLLAGEPLPAAEEYEGYAMLENGVGMVRDFLSDPLPALPARLPLPRKVLLATGRLFAPVLEAAVEPLGAVAGLDLEVRALRNRTFGEMTTVAGLLAGRDFLSQIEPSEADLLLVSPNVLKYGTELLLDDRTLDDLRRELRMEVEVGGSSLGELAASVLSGAGALSGPQFGFSTHALKEAARQH